nr:hypothetical protein [Staphylococcus chromogenes]
MDLILVKEAIKKLLKEQNGSQISKATGLPYQTVQDLRNGRTKIEDARFRTVEALYNYQKRTEEKVEKLYDQLHREGKLDKDQKVIESYQSSK